jgi:transglutaminase-like putative cysteine protease
MGMLPVDRPLGDLEDVTALVVEVTPALAGALEDRARQSVVRDPETGAIELRIGREHGVPQEATEDELHENLKGTVDYPTEHPRIRDLLADAVGEADDPRDKVESLVRFVHGYLDQDYSAEPLTVFDILNEREGDCTEFSLLFTTLARAAGIPARTVSGLLYMGDDVQSFGGHSWNEVVLDGRWVPVDAAWNEVEINATHITFAGTLQAEAAYVTAEKRPLVVKEVRHRGAGSGDSGAGSGD